jgi:hypothetical protein
MAALRTRFETFIKTTEDNGKLHLKKLSEHYGEKSDTARNADDHLRKISISSKCWHRFNTAPTLAFAFLIFIVAFWIIYNWDYLCQNAGKIDLSKCPNTAASFYVGFLVLVLTDVICFIGAGVAWLICGIHGKTLHQLYLTATDAEKEKINPA